MRSFFSRVVKMVVNIGLMVNQIRLFMQEYYELYKKYA